MNNRTIEIINLDIWKNYEYKGQQYYIEIFHYSDGTIQAFANKRANKVQHILEEFPIGHGWDDDDPKRAAVQAINNILIQ
ncbi:hypothetical protein ABC255_16800 [Neobacillus sp. 3P2-tot-E-2]|uniref:hypothetical protein n=1 Tax=Neobacillus sp. 3P2-tot-E-2 TaxID=3132212 RepID=UPI0039A21F72